MSGLKCQTTSKMPMLTGVQLQRQGVQHLRQRRGVVSRDKVRPEEQFRREEALVLHAAGLLRASPGAPEAVALGVFLQLGVVLAKLLRSAQRSQRSAILGSTPMLHFSQYRRWLWCGKVLIPHAAALLCADTSPGGCF